MRGNEINRQNYFEKIGTNILYLGGLLPGAFWPNEFASEIVMMLRNTDGYWVHDMTTLVKPAKQVVLREKTPGMADFSCLDEPKVYWELINKAHDIGSRTLSENRLTKTLHIITKPQKIKCVSKNKSKIKNTQFTSDDAFFEIDDAVLCNNLPTFKFEPASPVQCKRALSIYRSIGKASRPGEG